MNYSFTIFPTIFDNKTHRQMTFESWERFVEFLKKLSTKPGYKPKKGEKTDKKPSPLITPAIYRPDTTRANTNVLAWAGWCAMDIDDYDCKPDEILQRFKDYAFVCYNTASSRKEHPKFRMLFPLTRHLEADEIRHFWFSLNRKFDETADGQCKDLSRMYYIPAQYPEAYNFFFVNEGKDMNPDVLMNEFKEFRSKKSLKDTLPEAMKKRFAEFAKAKLRNRDYSWTGWKDCPFFKDELFYEYATINETGWYAKMYSMMVSVATKAIYHGYPITPEEIATLMHEVDNANGGWYKNRPIELEAARAIDFALNK